MLMIQRNYSRALGEVIIHNIHRFLQIRLIYPVLLFKKQSNDNTFFSRISFSFFMKNSSMNRVGSFISENMILAKLKKSIGTVTVSLFHQKYYSRESSSSSIDLSFYVISTIQFLIAHVVNISDGSSNGYR